MKSHVKNIGLNVTHRLSNERAEEGDDGKDNGTAQPRPHPPQASKSRRVTVAFPSATNIGSDDISLLEANLAILSSLDKTSSAAFDDIKNIDSNLSMPDEFKGESRRKRTSIMKFPEIEMIIGALNKRLATLDSMLESISSVEAETKAETVVEQDPQSRFTITITSEQRSDLTGLSSNVRGLLRCLSHRYDEGMGKKVDPNDDECEMDGTLQKIKSFAKSESNRKLLQDVVEYVGPQTTRRRSSRQTIALAKPSPSWRVQTHIPKELIVGVLQADSAQGGGGSAAYLAQEYGGVELPKRLTTRKRASMKVFARAVSGANTFVSHAKMLTKIGKNELEYLPREFTRLKLSERKRLATLLTWEGLKTWGFDSFEVERLSSITHFHKQGSFNQRKSFSYSEGKLVMLDDEPSRELSGASSPEEEDVVQSVERGCPIVIIGWALLASPYAQFAMAKNVNDQELMDVAYKAIKQRANTSKGEMAQRIIDDENEEATLKGEAGSEETSGGQDDDAWSGGYFLPDEFKIDPRAICQFLRKVEKEYSPRKVNPYHNNIHAADVAQSTHALIQMGGHDMMIAYSPIEIYSILLAAILHDIRHPGTNNNYQVNKLTDLTLTYNDVSVLENMHASMASHYLVTGLGEGGNARDREANAPGILGRMTKEQHKMARASIIKSILSTDMSQHFSEVGKLNRQVEELEIDIMSDVDFEKETTMASHFLKNIIKEKNSKLREKFLPFLLHMADISNPTKPHDVSVEWANCVYDEFFLQGDKEAEEDMPISPLCDRTKTNRPEAQVGFMTFVVKPAFELLSRCLPRVESVIMTQLEENLAYWNKEKEKMSEEKEETK